LRSQFTVNTKNFKTQTKNTNKLKKKVLSGSHYVKFGSFYSLISSQVANE